MANYVGVLLIAMLFFLAGVLTSRPLLKELRTVIAALRDEVLRLRRDVQSYRAAANIGVRHTAGDIGKEVQKL